MKFLLVAILSAVATTATPIVPIMTPPIPIPTFPTYPLKFCPARNCYSSPIAPVCLPGRACPQYIMQATACAWNIYNNNVPQGCKKRCKPCPPGRFCTDICTSEIICTSGPCLRLPIPIPPILPVPVNSVGAPTVTNTLTTVKKPTN